MQHAKTKVPLFQPFRHERFRDLCLANFVSNIGGWMQIFATGWLLAKQSNDPATAVFAQTATQAPIFLFALFGGVVADRMDQSRYLLLVNAQMLVSSALLAVLSFHSMPTSLTIILLTFALGVGAAFKVSAWQASMSSLVAPNEIEAAATLNGLSYNLSSIIGPILGGFAFAFGGPAFLYAANAISFLGLIILYWRTGKLTELSPAINKEEQTFLDSLKTGVERSLSLPAFRRILGLTFILFFSISIFQSLLPIYVKLALSAEERILSWLMAAFGGGAVFAAFLLPSLRYVLHRNQLLSAATAIYATMLLCFGYTNLFYLLLLVSLMGGFSWACLVSTMNSGAQAAFKIDMRARALAVYSLVFSGALTMGSIVWGKIAELLGISFAFRGAGLIMLLTSVSLLALHIRSSSRMRNSPSAISPLD